MALSIFPDPVTGRYKDAGWQAIGDELKSLLSPGGVRQCQPHRLQASSTPRPSSCRRCTGRSAASACPADATLLEPGCGTGNFIAARPEGHAVHRRRARWPLRPHRPCPPPRRTTSASKLSATRSCPRGDRCRHRQPAFRRRQARLSRPEACRCTIIFFAKSVDSLKPGGILALVTTTSPSTSYVVDHITCLMWLCPLCGVQLPGATFSHLPSS